MTLEKHAPLMILSRCWISNHTNVRLEGAKRPLSGRQGKSQRLP
ncbi:hypothetical protein DFAR_340040 [Desulfarculales bacterium]